MDIDSDWVTFIIACLFVFFILCLSIILRKNCSNLFCHECTHGSNELQDQQQQQPHPHPHHRGRRPRSRERELQQLRIEQLRIHQQLHQVSITMISFQTSLTVFNPYIHVATSCFNYFLILI